MIGSIPVKRRDGSDLLNAACPAAPAGEERYSHPPAHLAAPGADIRPASGGRPTKYDPAYCDQMIAHCSDGYSLTSFAGIIGVSRTTLANWAESHPEFADATQVAKAIAAHWWEKRARTVADGDGGPGAASMCQFALKNLAEADFTDRREVMYGGAIQHSLMTYEQALEEARRRGLPERVLLPEMSALPAPAEREEIE